MNAALNDASAPASAPESDFGAEARLRPTLLLARGGALLLLLALLTGGYAAAAMTGQVPADPHTALAAHVTALLGTFWLFAVAWSLPLLRYGPVGQTRMAWALLVSNYAGWFITAGKALLHVHGVAPGEGATNTAVFAALNVLVVLPALAASVAWVLGFKSLAALARGR